ncbi:hypothetical protein [Streptomyces sp. NPDC102462]
MVNQRAMVKERHGDRGRTALPALVGGADAAEAFGAVLVPVHGTVVAAL